MSCPSLRKLWFVLPAFLLVALVSVAQTGNSSLRGTVLDPKGASVPDATVTITNPEFGITLTAKTDKDGAYQFVEVRPGTYALSVSAAGFANYKQSGLVLLVATPTTNNVSMQLASVATTVEVVTSAQTINTQDATLGNAFTQTQIAALPFEGRDPVAILSLQPGVVTVAANRAVDETADSRGGAVNGARSDQTNVVLDGVDNNDQLHGFAFKGAVRATLDSIEEFRVTTTNSGADQGRSSGAQVQLVTKSGTNEWHGTAYEYNRPTNLVANQWFNKHAQLQNGEPNTPPRLLRNTFGGSFGGPVKKDRVFFFVAYEGQRTRESSQQTRNVPSAALRDGVIQYDCLHNPDGSENTALCPGNTVKGVSGASYTAIPGFQVLGPAEIAQMDPNCTGNSTCPWGPGVDPNSLAVMNSVPLPNSDLVGDGFNYRGFTFSAQTPNKLDTYIAKFDVNLNQSGTQRLFTRLGLQNDHASGPAQFPGQVASTVDTNNSKSVLAGYSWTISPTKINNLRYGFIRQGTGANGISDEQWVSLRGLDLPSANTRTTNVIVPVHNFVDDFSWTKSKHTFQFGGNWRFVNNIRSSTAGSFSDAITNAGFLPTTGYAGKNTSFDPSCDPAANASCTWSFPRVDPSFANAYNFPMTALAGIITEVDATYQRDKNANTLSSPTNPGAVINRHFRDNELEFYAQDAWRIKSNVTITYGLRYSLLQPPYETNGEQVAPTISLNDFFNTRMKDMVQGISFAPNFTLGLSGKANGGKPYWDWDYKNIAPRFSLAWSPGYKSGLLGSVFGGPGKSSIRFGAGVYYDHFGQGIINTFDRNGSFGLTTTVADAPGTVDADTAPRFTGLHDIPGSLTPPGPSGPFPVTPPTADQLGGFAIYWGLDDKLKTPYSYAFDMSFSRELKGGFVFEAAYVGRLGRRLLQERDLANPVNLSDPKSNTNYFQAATQFAILGDANQGLGTDISQVGNIPYWQNLFPAAAGTLSNCAPNSTGITNPTATQAMYDAWFCGQHNQTTPLFVADLFCFPACANSVNNAGNPFNYYQSQFASLYAWSSIGRSNYNAAQFSLRHRASHGLSWDFNYTYSKSIDLGSNAERISLFEGFGFASQIINPFDPGQNRAVSDYDATHQINSSWVYEFPLGRGKKWGSGWNRGVDAILGGWSLSGLYRWSSGLPFSIGDGFNFPTNWELTGQAVQIAPVKTGLYTDTGGNPNAFAVSTQPGGIASILPGAINPAFRFAYPGEAGNRNNLRGPGYFDVDVAMRKTWKITERQSLAFSAEAFNVTNSVRFGFDATQAGSAIDTSGSFGRYSQTLTSPRVMEFSLRYSF